MEKRQRNLLLGGVSLAALAVAAVLFFGGYGRPAEAPSDYVVHCVCLACQQEADVHAIVGEPPPFVCEACGERAVYPWRYCSDCKHRFVPNLVRPDPDGPLRIPPMPSCRNCGSSRVGAYVPELMMDQEAAPAAKLPDWEP